MTKKVALFVEGKSELIFVKHLLQEISRYSRIKIDCFKILTDNNLINEDYPYCSPPVKVEILLVEVGGDRKVASAIKDRANGLFSRGFRKIWGLRDMYSEAYDRQSNGKIDKAVTDKEIASINSIFKNIDLSGGVRMFFSVMELEAWFLGFYNVLDRIGLPTSKINKLIQEDITKIDPEVKFFKPKRVLSSLCKSIWNKNYDEIDFAFKISNKINLDDIRCLARSKKVSHFRTFYSNLVKQLNIARYK